MAAEVYPEDQYPFLSLQMNSFLQRIRNPKFEPDQAPAPLLYQKPEALCKPIFKDLPNSFWQDQIQFSREWRESIARALERQNLSISKLDKHDTPRVISFLHRRYPAELAKEICAFDLYRFKQFGHGVVLENKDKEVVGNVFEVAYDTSDRTSYTIRLAVDERLKGQNLGYHIMVYSSLLAMERGSRVKRGLIQFDNHQSLHINLNKVGWICSGFDPEIVGLGSFFEIALPLNIDGLATNAVDLTQVPSYLQSHRKGTDYQLIASHDMDAVVNLYEKTDFKIAAFVMPGLLAHNQSYFLALSPEQLSLQDYVSLREHA